MISAYSIRIMHLRSSSTDRTIICCLSARLPEGERVTFAWNDRMQVDNTTREGGCDIGSTLVIRLEKSQAK